MAGHRAIAIATLGAVLGGAAPPPALTFFSDRFYRGQAKVYTLDEGDIRTAFEPRSVRSQGRWLVCSEPRFKGRCVEIDRDFPIDTGMGLNFNIRSLRPMAEGTGAARPPPDVPPGGASLAGVSSRFFPAPAFGTERTLACPSGAPSKSCAKATAEDVCRRAGYREAQHFVLQSVRGLYYLADLLCVRR